MNLRPLLFSVLLVLGSAQSMANPIDSKSNDRLKASYSYGYLIGKTNGQNLQGIDTLAFAQGLEQALKGETATLSDEEMIQVLTEFKKKIESNQLVQLQQQAAENAKSGQIFLAENAKRSDIKTTKSGLQYQVLKQGKGKSPKAKSTVEVHYEGQLLDGTVFDSSFARDKPASFQLTQVITGWQEGLSLMQPGSRYRFFIPAHLAYGEIGAGDRIAPNSTLIFDIELIRIIE